jgi:Protein of unknown function (DUF4242)
MTSFLMETFVPASRGSDVAESALSAMRAAEALAREGTAVRFVRSTFVPADEVCFHLFEAASADAVLAVGDRAALTVTRVVEALEAFGPDARE